MITHTEHVIRFHLEFFFAFRNHRHRHAIRKSISTNKILHNVMPHLYANVLGVYKGEPFVTGSYNPENKKTEILDYVAKQWNVVADYPFNSGKQ